MVRVEDGRTVRRWEAGNRGIPGPVTVLLETAMSYIAEKERILTQLDMLQSGKMRTGTSRGNRMVDDTPETIARLSEAKASYDNALKTLTILTRQPPVGGISDQVHWYHLRRLTPLFEPARKDDWSVPGELSCEAALAYFEKHEGFGEGLEICEDWDSTAEFTLEKRLLLRTQSPSGASQWLRAGNMVETYFVRRRRVDVASAMG
jgi:hypothetical protein